MTPPKPELLATAVELVETAGRYAWSRRGDAGKIRYKGDIDPVTEVDAENEARMVALLQQRYPDHAVVAEEGGGEDRPASCRWYLDPLDGTVNFAHGLPWFSVLAAVQVDGVTEAGAIYVPGSQELFTAVRGGGAWCNGERIAVSNQVDIRRSVLGTGFPYDVGQRVGDIVRPLQAFLQLAQGIRRVGSAAMDLCQVACGRYDAFWELGLHVWDVAAGFLIIKEAGGRVSDFGGRPGDLLTDRVLASNGHLHDTMLQTLSESHGA